MKNYGELLVETNNKGRKVFVKERKGKKYIYFATDGTFNGLCHPREMTKEEVIANQDFLTNVGVSGDRIYPVTDLQDRKVLPEGFTRCEACGSIMLESNSYRYFVLPINDDPDEDINICENCNNNGHNGYIVCNACDNPCWVKKDSLYETVYSNDDDFICEGFIDNYTYCEKCRKHYPSELWDCPCCGK